MALKLHGSPMCLDVPFGTDRRVCVRVETSRDDQDGECAALVVHFAASDATRGVALGLLRALEPRAARLALDRLLANAERAHAPPFSEPPATKRKGPFT